MNLEEPAQVSQIDQASPPGHHAIGGRDDNTLLSDDLCRRDVPDKKVEFVLSPVLTAGAYFFPHTPGAGSSRDQIRAIETSLESVFPPSIRVEANYSAVAMIVERHPSAALNPDARSRVLQRRLEPDRPDSVLGQRPTRGDRERAVQTLTKGGRRDKNG